MARKRRRGINARTPSYGRVRIPPPNWIDMTTLGGPYGGPTSALPHSKWVSPSAPAVSTPPTTRAQPPFPGYLTADQMLARARAAVMGAIGPQQDYYNKLIQQNQAQAEARAKFVAGLYQALGQFQRGVAPAVQQAYAQAGNDQAAIAQGYSGNMRDVAAQDAAAINADLAKAGTPQGGMVPGDQGAANVLYALGGAIPGRMLGAQGAAFGSAAAFLPSSTAGYGVRQAEYGLSQADQKRQEIQAELDKLVASEPSLIQEQLASLQNNQSDAQRWWTQFNYNKAQDTYQKQQDAAAARAKAEETAYQRKMNAIAMEQAGVKEAGQQAIDVEKLRQQDEKLRQQQASIDERIRHNRAIEQNQAVSVQERRAANAANRKLKQQSIAIQKQRAAIAAKNASVQSSYNSPQARRQKAVRAREQAFDGARSKATSRANALSGKGATWNEAFAAIYGEIAPELLRYATPAGRKAIDERIRAEVRRALRAAGWKKIGKNTSSRYKKSGSSNDPFN